ncbi:MAG: hypothetical protein FJ387_14130 [Verrucomicrobia bacterium]|nr:hypothetical protein [Verrucomicrobiota bacterium]
MKKKHAIAMLALAASCAASLAAETEYKHPVAVIPYAATKPVIDGKVDDAEWQGAFSQRALRTTGGQISSRQARFWMMWDEENLYIAMRDPLRPGERPIQVHRGRPSGTDLDIIFDDCYEIWVSVGATDTLTGQPNCSAQFLGNFSGGRYDAIHQPAVGNSRTSSYDTNWEPKSRLTDKNEWEMELVIPRASLGTTKGPFHDGMRFRTLIARNYKRPWEQCSFEGTSSFSVIDTHSEFVMSKTAPALHLLGVGDAAAGKVGIHLAALGQTDAKIAWRYASEAVIKEGTAEVKKGTLGEVVNLPELDTPGDGKGKVRITVTGAGGATLLDWQTQRAFGAIPTETIADRGDVLNLGITFNPVRDYARVFGDFINYDNRAAIKEIVILVRDAAGKEIKRAKTAIDADAYAKGVLHFDNLPMGAYTVRLECLAKDGKVLAGRDSTFAKEDLAQKYQWWNTPRGSIEKVVSPWTPVTLKGSTLGVWGREMEIGAAGIPARVSTQGKEILAAPGRLVATLTDGKQVTAEGVKTKTRFDQDHRKIVAVESKLGEIAVSSEVRAEFDGMYKVTMTLTPKGPVAVKDLKLVLPYREAMGEYVHAVTAEIRSGYYYGFTPAGTGRVWDCRTLGDKTMKVGSFIPYVWLGSTKGGLCWFADSDEGWMPNDEVPAIEIQRNRAGEVDLVFNLVSAAATLDAPRTITFALQASPVKAMPPRWREENWWCGDTFRQYAHDQNLIFASTPFVVPAYAEKAKEIVAAQHKAGRPAVPYFIHSVLPGYLVPELGVLAEEWQTPYGSYGSKALCYRGSFVDYMIHNWSKWAEEYGIDGYYIDNMVPMQCDNHEHGCGYRLPDGRIQPTFQMFGTREYFLRSRTAFLEKRPKSMMVIHMTNCEILPWVGAADLTYDGEHHVIYPEMKKDFMDFWSLERMRVNFPGQWGVPVDFMHEYQGQWAAADMYRAKRAYYATVMLHDALPYGNHNGYAGNLIAQRKAFGIGEDDVKFLAYWDETGLKAKGDDIKLAGWQRPGKLLLLVANFGEKHTAQVALDLDKLGWRGATLAVSDPEQGQSLSVHGHGGPATVTHDAPAPQLDGATLTVPVERHNYRLLIIEKK